MRNIAPVDGLLERLVAVIRVASPWSSVARGAPGGALPLRGGCRGGSSSGPFVVPRGPIPARCGVHGAPVSIGTLVDRRDPSRSESAPATPTRQVAELARSVGAGPSARRARGAVRANAARARAPALPVRVRHTASSGASSGSARGDYILHPPEKCIRSAPERDFARRAGVGCDKLRVRFSAVLPWGRLIPPGPVPIDSLCRGAPVPARLFSRGARCPLDCSPAGPGARSGR